MIIRKIIYSLLYLWIILITILSVVPSSDLPKTFIFHNIDKVVHFIFYMVLSVLIFIRLSESIKFTKKATIITSIVFPILYSGIIEIIQEYAIATREGDWFDFLANLLGTIAGFLLIYYTFPKIEKFFINKKKTI